MSRIALPIDEVLPDLLEALRAGPRALLIAPPGAGKTTRVAPALLDEPWVEGRQILLLVPRRLAARSAAEFMARERGEEAGATIGYATRLDSRVGKSTRVIAMTHGVYLSRIQADPELAGVAAVLFDEVHERSLDSDLALALTLDAAEELRPDLRILPMSATLDGERFARLLGEPPRIESEGKSYPLTLVHEGRDTGQRIEPQMASAIRRALNEHDGSLLAFLPGVAEIERTAEALGQPATQRRPAPPARRDRAGPAARRAGPAQAGHAQAGAGQRDRRDQPDARRCPDRGRQRPCPPPALRSRRGPDPAGYRARQPGRRHAARRPRRSPGTGRRDPLVGGSCDGRAARPTTRRRYWKPTCRACC